MKTKILIIFSLLLICLIAFPGSAWECTFQNHPDDAYPDCIYGTPTAILIENGTNRYYQTSYATQFVNIAGDYSDYFAFTYYMSGSAAWDGIEITPYYANGTAASSALYIAKPSSTYTGTVRYQFQRIGITSQFYCLRDGVQISTPTLWASNADIAYIKFSLKADGSSSVMRLDDISTDDVFILGFNNYVNPGSNLTITSGVETYNYFNFYLKIIDDEGNTVYTSPSFSSTTAVYNTTAPEDGNYTVRIMGYNSSLSNPAHYIFYSKTLDVSANTPDVSAIVQFSKNEYDPDDTVKILTHLSPYDSGYKVIYKYFSGYLSNSITQEDQTFSYAIPDDDTNYIFAYLIDSSGDVLAYDQAEITGRTPTPVMELDKSSYSPSDTITVSYWYMPAGTKLTATYYLNGVKKSTSTLTINDVIGVEYFTIGGRDADSVTITASSDTEVYAYSSADILYGNYHVSGKVFDSETGAAVPDATVYTSSFTVYTDSQGAYNHSISPGQNYVTISADGYEDLHTSMYITNLVSTKNFYIVPEYVSGDSSVYGMVVDYYNGSAVQGALVSLKQGSTTYTALTTKKGYFLIDQAEMSGSWNLTVSHTGYESYASVITVSGDTYEDISLVPTGGASSDSGSSSSSSSSDNDEENRPGREAARESMEQFEALAPALIALVVIKVIKELMK